MIRDAGFDGAGVRFIDPGYAREVTGFLARQWHDLAGAVLSAERRRPGAGAGPGRRTRRRPRQPAAGCAALQPGGVHPLSGGLAPPGGGGRHPGACRDPPRPHDHRPVLHPAAAGLLSRPAADRRPVALPGGPRIRLAGRGGEPRADPPHPRQQLGHPWPGRQPGTGAGAARLPAAPGLGRAVHGLVGIRLPVLAPPGGAGRHPDLPGRAGATALRHHRRRWLRAIRPLGGGAGHAAAGPRAVGRAPPPPNATRHAVPRPDPPPPRASAPPPARPARHSVGRRG